MELCNKAGSRWKLDELLGESEDSVELNTAFIERLNLTIRQGAAYLGRRSPCHVRRREALEEGSELFRCYYNFCRPHGSLRFGREVRTPAMQAGLATRKLTLRETFPVRLSRMVFAVGRLRVEWEARAPIVDCRAA